MSFTRCDLLFREVETGDLLWLRALRNSPNFDGGRRDARSLQTLEQQQAWYKTLGATNQAFVVVDGDTRIGLLRISNFDWLHRSVGLTGCDVHPDHSGKGYGTKIMRSGAEYCILTLGMHRVTAQAMDTNPAAQRIILKAGFTLEGVWRKYLRRDNVWHDFLQYSILEDEL